MSHGLQNIFIGVMMIIVTVLALDVINNKFILDMTMECLMAWIPFACAFSVLLHLTFFVESV